MDILAKLFGSAARVRIMRLFLMNPEDVFDVKDTARRTKVDAATLRKELRLLEEVGLIKSRQFMKLEAANKNSGGGKNGDSAKKKTLGYEQDPKFPFLASLRALVTEIAIGNEDIAARFKDVGHLKVLIVSGVFIDEPDSRVDVLIVGDRLKKPKIEGALRRLEAEIGKELTYGILDTEEFKYRHGIYDKFVRDVLDYPHQVVVNKLNLF